MSDWLAVIPVKTLHAAKSRLAVEPDVRQQLAEAFALDVFACVASTPNIVRVVVVSAQESIRRAAAEHGFSTIDEPPAGGPDPLNDAILRAAEAVSRDLGDHRIVVIPGDLPSMDPSALAEALFELEAHPHAFVPDADGSGTSLLAAHRTAELSPLYGPGSAARHEATGRVPVAGVGAGVRQDVDSLADVMAAEAIGLGAKTLAVWTSYQASLAST